MTRWLRVSACVLFLGTLLVGAQGAPVPPAAPAESWLVFRGNPEQRGLASSALPDKVETLWTFKDEDGFEGAVAVADGVAYVGSLGEQLYALDLANGKVKWKYKAGPIKAAPAVRKDEVVVGDLDGTVHCVAITGKDAGKKRWTFSAGAEIGGINFSGDLILASSHDENLYCLTKDGKERWHFKTEGPVYGAPTVANGKTFLVGCDSEMHVIDIDKGKEIRSVNLGGQTGATAAVVGNRLYVGTMNNEVLALDWEKGASAWTFRSKRRAQAFFSSPAVTDKVAVIGSRDNRVYALNRADGTEQWAFLTGGKVDSSPVIAPGPKGPRVVVGSFDERLYILDLETGRELQRVTLDGPIAASPIVVDGKILVGTQKGTLYCLGARK
jgi:outer membrane protein assembly factor BamB